MVNYLQSGFLLLFLFISISQSGFCEIDSTYYAEDIAERWESFNDKTKTRKYHLPNQMVNSLRLTLQSSEFKGSKLLIQCADNPMIVLNNKVIGFIADSIYLDFDSLYSIYPSERFDISLFNEEGIHTQFLKSVLYKKIPAPEISPIRSRIINPFFNNFTIATLLIFSFLAFIVNKFPKDSADYGNILRSIAITNREESLVTSRPLSRTNLIFSTLNALLLGFLVVSLNSLTPQTFNFPILISYPFLLRWLSVSVIIFGSIIIKYGLINTFCSLFVLGEFRYIQFFNSLRFSIIIALVSFLILSFVYLTIREVDLSFYYYIVYFFVFLIVVRAIILFFKLLNFSSRKLFHLFIYLCATELIPSIILFKIVLG